ncbi:MAG: hypothetical protein ACJ786_18335 [Catenulispora sp.]
MSYLKGGTGLTTATAGTADAQTLPPYSITTLQLTPVGGKTGSTAPAAGKNASSPAAVTPTSLRSFPAAGTPGTTSAGRLGAAPDARTSTGTPQGNGATTASTSSGGAAAHDAGASIGPLALTGSGSVVTYGVASVMAIAAGSALMLRRRKVKSAHRQ